MSRNKSWQCHLCGAVYAPTVTKCKKCSKNESTKPEKQLLVEGK